MSEARDAFAAKLNRREYRAEMTPSEEAEAKAARLLVVFGASDDLTEFRGIIDDEAGAYDGAQHGVLLSEGRWIIFEGDPESRKPQKTKVVLINAVWAPSDEEGAEWRASGASWLIKPSVPFAPFDIMEGSELYCRGAVIDEVDLLPAQRALGVSRDPGSPQTLLVSFSAALSDDDMRSVHEFLREWSR